MANKTTNTSWFRRSKNQRHKKVDYGTGDPFAHIEVVTPYYTTGISVLYQEIYNIRNNGNSISKLESLFNKFYADVFEMAMQAAYTALVDTFNNGIKEFYASYSPEYYVRHWESPHSTSKALSESDGTNLLLGNQFTIHGHGYDTTIEFDYDGSAMAGYASGVSTDTVLDITMGGKRIMGRTQSGKAKFASWSFSYSVYWTALNSMVETFDDIYDNWDSFILKFIDLTSSRLFNSNI